MAYRYLDHGADMGIETEANTLEALFGEAARGLFGLMVDLEDVDLDRAVKIDLKSSTSEGLLYEWLSEILSLSNLRNEVYSDFQDLDIEKSDSEFKLHGRARGESLDPATHELGTEVKAITYQGLEISEDDGTWRCRFVVDV